MNYKPITHIVGLTFPARDFVFVKKLVCSRVNMCISICECKIYENK